MNESNIKISKAAAALGSVKSPAKAAASRKNGKLGGRPKGCLIGGKKVLESGRTKAIRLLGMEGKNVP